MAVPTAISFFVVGRTEPTYRPGGSRLSPSDVRQTPSIGAPNFRADTPSQACHSRPPMPPSCANRLALRNVFEGWRRSLPLCTDLVTSPGRWALPGIALRVARELIARSSRPESASQSDRNMSQCCLIRRAACRLPCGRVEVGRRTGRVPARWLRVGGRRSSGAVRGSPVRTYRRRPPRRISCSRAVSALRRPDRLCGESGLRWCRDGRDRPFSLQLDVCARIAL